MLEAPRNRRGGGTGNSGRGSAPSPQDGRAKRSEAPYHTRRIPEPVGRRLAGYPLPDAAAGADGYERARCADLERMSPEDLAAERAELTRALRESGARRAARPRAIPPFVLVGTRSVPADEWAGARMAAIDRRLARGRA